MLETNRGQKPAWNCSSFLSAGESIASVACFILDIFILLCFLFMYNAYLSWCMNVRCVVNLLRQYGQKNSTNLCFVVLLNQIILCFIFYFNQIDFMYILQSYVFTL